MAIVWTVTKNPFTEDTNDFLQTELAIFEPADSTKKNRIYSPVRRPEVLGQRLHHQRGDEVAEAGALVEHVEEVVPLGDDLGVRRVDALLAVDGLLLDALHEVLAPDRGVLVQQLGPPPRAGVGRGEGLGDDAGEDGGVDEACCQP